MTGRSAAQSGLEPNGRWFRPQQNRRTGRPRGRHQMSAPGGISCRVRRFHPNAAAFIAADPKPVATTWPALRRLPMNPRKWAALVRSIRSTDNAARWFSPRCDHGTCPARRLCVRLYECWRS